MTWPVLAAAAVHLEPPPALETVACVSWPDVFDRGCDPCCGGAAGPLLSHKRHSPQRSAGVDAAPGSAAGGLVRPPGRLEKATPLVRGTLEWDSNAYAAGTLASRDCLAATAPAPPPRPLHVYSRCGGLPRRAGRERSPRHDAGRVCRSAPTARIHDPPHRTGCLARDPVGPPRGRDGKARPARIRRV